MSTLGEVVALLEEWYPPAHADDWDAVGLVCGDPADEVRRIHLAVDPTVATVAEALEAQAQLLVTHHPLLLKGVHSVAATSPKGRVVHGLVTGGCALYAAHTNADSPVLGVSESLALALGLVDVRPLEPDDDVAPGEPDRGSGRVGRLPEPTTLRAFAEHVGAVLPASAHGVRVAGDPDQRVETVGLCGGAGDFLLDRARALGVDVYVTSDLRHHPASELREHAAVARPDRRPGAPALVDVAHWAAESTWLPVLRRRLVDALGDTVSVHVSRVVTDPWDFHVPQQGAPTTAPPQPDPARRPR